MTDSVSIDSFGPGIKGWATEETAKQMLSAMQGLLKSNNRANSRAVHRAANGSSSDFRDLEKSLKENNRQYKANNKSLKENNQGTEKQTGALKRSVSALGTFATSLVTGVTAVAGALYAAATASMDTQLELYRAGMAFSGAAGGAGSTLTSLTDMMKGTNLTFGDLKKLTAEYSTTLAREGTGAFTRYSRSLRKNFQDVGMVSQESAEWMASYLKGQEKYAYRQKLSEAQQTAAMRTGVTELNKWSQILGLSKKQIQDSINAEKEKPNVAAYIAGLSSASTQAFEGALGQLANAPGLKAKLSEAIADPFIMRSELIGDLLRGGASDAANILIELQKAIQHAPDRVPELMDKFRKSLADQGTTQALAMGEPAHALLGIIGEMNAAQQAVEKQRDVARAGVKDQVHAKDAMTELVVSLQAMISRFDAFLPVVTEFFNVMSRVVHEVDKKIVSPLLESDGLKRAMDYLATFDPAQFVTAASDSISEALAGIDGKTVAMWVGGALAAAILGPAVAGAVLKGIGGAISKLLGVGGKAAGAASAGGMAGVAKGLSFFSNPVVLRGGLGLAAIIAAIGAAFAAATWLIGKSLNTFAEGMLSLQQLDGKKLYDIGIGIGEVGKGLAIFAGSKVLESFASISTSFASIFSDENDNPLEHLRRFAESASSIGAPLEALGKSLSVFAPSFREFMEALSYEVKFDYEKFSEALTLLSGGTLYNTFSKNVVGLQSTQIEMFKKNMQELSSATSGLSKSAEETDRFAISIDRLATSIMRLNGAKRGEFAPGSTTIPMMSPTASSLGIDEAEIERIVNAPVPAVSPTQTGAIPNTVPAVGSGDIVEELRSLVNIANSQLDTLNKIRRLASNGEL